MEATAAFGEGVNESNFHKAPWTSEGCLGLQDQLCGSGDAGSFLPGEGAPSVFARKALVLPTARRFKLLVAEAGGGGLGRTEGPTTCSLCRSEGERQRECGTSQTSGKTGRRETGRGRRGPICLSTSQAGGGFCPRLFSYGHAMVVIRLRGDGVTQLVLTCLFLSPV